MKQGALEANSFSFIEPMKALTVEITALISGLKI
jgi:hypothetical protein